MKTKTTTHTVTTHKKLSANNKAKHQELLEIHAPSVVQRLESLDYDNLDKSASVHDLDPKTPSIYQEMISQADQALQGWRVLEEQRADEENTKQKLEEYTATIDEKSKKEKVKRGQLDERAKRLAAAIKMWVLWKGVKIFVTFLEFLFLYDVFFAFGGNLAVAIGTGLVVALIIYLYGELSAVKIREIAKGNVLRSLGLFFLALLPIVLVLHQLAIVRVDYMTAMSDENLMFNLSPMLFTFINGFIFTVCFWITYRYKPSKKDRNRYANYNKAIAEIEQIQKEIVKLKKERAELKPALRERAIARQGVLLLGKQLEQEINNYYHECLSEIKLELMLRTHSAVIPIYNRSSIPPLKFNYQNISL